ncbi:MAG: thiamine diphosphokinase [Lachnospiraceae bacterium]|nr:thiamine diphosphokinase [Lachnospiraceae bacterium]
MITYILSGGQLDLPFAEKILGQREDKVIIAADRGVEACEKLGITPDYIIGDFDSVSEAGQAFLQGYTGTVVSLNPVKDDTDTEAALHLAFDNTQGDIVILGGTGTRLDHVMGNISILRQGIERGRRVLLVDPYNRIRVVEGRLSIEKEKQFGDYVSVFPLEGRAEGVTLTGFFYPLQDAVLEGASSLGVSNEIVEARADISVKNGCLLVIESRDEK